MITKSTLFRVPDSRVYVYIYIYIYIYFVDAVIRAFEKGFAGFEGG